METVQIEQPDSAALVSEGQSLVKWAEGFEVHDAASMSIAGVNLINVVKLQRKIVDFFAKSKGLAHQLHKTICADERKALRLPTEARERLEAKRFTYAHEVEAKRRAEEDRLRAVARKEEEDRRLAEAEKLEREGNINAAEAVIAAPIRTPPIVLRSEVPKTEGISGRVTWKHRIVSAKLVPPGYWMLNEAAIAAHGRAMGEAAHISGVEFYPVASEYVRARADG